MATFKVKVMGYQTNEKIPDKFLMKFKDREISVNQDDIIEEKLKKNQHHEVIYLL